MNNEIKETKEFLKLCLDFSEGLLQCGAEINRVEDTVIRMSQSFKTTRANVFVITSSVIVTLEMPNGETLTESRRVLSGGDTDFTRLEELNRLSRDFCSGNLTVAMLKSEFERCMKRPKSAMKSYIGSLLAAGGFTVFFGGTLCDSLVSAAFAVLICFCIRSFASVIPNAVVSKFLYSLFSGLAICAVCKALPFLNADKIIIGDIMLLIPGLNLTNSISNIIVGDTVSGIMRFTESIVQAAALAAGFMLAILAFGG